MPPILRRQHRIPKMSRIKFSVHEKLKLNGAYRVYSYAELHQFVAHDDVNNKSLLRKSDAWERRARKSFYYCLHWLTKNQKILNAKYMNVFFNC